MINWSEIETVLLDMDGTLLDLHFDHYFWQTQLPEKWSVLNDVDLPTAKAEMQTIFRNIEATLPWYCLDHWSEQLKMDVFEIKNGIEHLIKIRPHVEVFLTYLREINKKIVLVTNSHKKFIDLKMALTGLEPYFQQIFNAHSFGVPKEDWEFWQILDEQLSFDGESTLLIDDNLSVLRSAQRHGIRHLLAIAKPNSQAPIMDTAEFAAVSSFKSLCY